MKLPTFWTVRSANVWASAIYFWNQLQIRAYYFILSVKRCTTLFTQNTLPALTTTLLPRDRVRVWMVALVLCVCPKRCWQKRKEDSLCIWYIYDVLYSIFSLTDLLYTLKHICTYTWCVCVCAHRRVCVWMMGVRVWKMEKCSLMAVLTRLRS